MARPVTSKVKKFSLAESEVVEENERILSQKTEQHTPAATAETAPHGVAQPDTEPQQHDIVQPQTTAQTVISTPQSVAVTPEAAPQQSAPTGYPSDTGLEELAAMRKPKGKKTENGITVYVPMEYYERIVLMKMRTGIPIRDLALQAVIEFLDKNMG